MSKKHFPIKKIFVVLLVAGAIAAGFFWWQNSNSQQPAPTDTGTVVGTPPTYTTETEGQEITVPEDVPEDAIKDYRLITENEQFKIRELNGTYTITLYAIINGPEQYDYYIDQLREYKNNALAYMRNHNINPDEITIIYEPEEAKDL